MSTQSSRLAARMMVRKQDIEQVVGNLEGLIHSATGYDHLTSFFRAMNEREMRQQGMPKKHALLIASNGTDSRVGSLTADLLVMAVAGCAFIVIEGRRLGMRHLWAYIVFSGLTAIAFTFPLFLMNRERHLERQRQNAAAHDHEVEPGASGQGSTVPA